MGLAQRMQGPQAAPQGQMPTVEQIVELIMQGMEPDELLEQGVPEELVMAAMDMISKQATEIPSQEAGLANTLVRPEQM